MRRLIWLAALTVLFGGCSHWTVEYDEAVMRAKRERRVAEEEALAESARIANEARRRDVGRGINIEGASFEADLPASADRGLVRELVSEEAARADFIRTKTGLVKKASSAGGAGADSSRSTIHSHFWYDERGNEWVRGYWHNISPYTLSNIRVDGAYREGGIPSLLVPGGKIEDLWALAGTRVYLVADKKDGRGKIVGRVNFFMDLRSAGINPHDSVGGVDYHWKVVTP